MIQIKIKGCFKMAGRPSKPLHLVKKHLTKKEIDIRKQAESSLITGIPLKEKIEVQQNEIAHQEFLRLQELLMRIDKNDDLYGDSINRHCVLVAEIHELNLTKEKMTKKLDNLQNTLLETEDEAKVLAVLQKQILEMDKCIMSRRKLIHDISKENILTIASALRSVPKQPDKKEEDDPMERFFSSRN